MTTDVTEAVGQALRAMRRASGLSQQEVARSIGSTQATISRWENGTVTPDVEALAYYTAAVGGTPTALFTTAYADGRAEKTVAQAIKRAQAFLNNNG